MRLRIASVVTSASQAYSWSVNLTASRLLVPVAVGPNNGFAQVAYTAAFTRTRADGFTYTLSGAVALWSGDGVAHVVDVPTVTVVTSAGNTVALPAGAVNCPALTVPTTGELTCTFSGSVTMAQEPVPGSVSATATVPGVSLPFVMRSGSARYDFSVAERADVGSTAVVGNYFESGAGLLQPYGVSGEQPPPGLTLEDSRTFTFTALYGEIPVSACQQSATWTAINTAELRPGAGLGGGLAGPALSETQQQRLQQAQANVTLNLVGCDNFAAGTAATSPAPAFAGVDSSTAAAPTTPAAVPAPVPAAVAPAAPAPLLPGVQFASAGSTICGAGVCQAGERCFDGFNCCPAATPVCGGECCSAPKACINQRCAVVGSVPCGDNVCAPGSQCLNGVCCAATAAQCGNTCCPDGQICVAGQCAPQGSIACGTAVCSASQICVSGICCAQGESACGGRCCAAGNTCLQNQYCAAPGSSICAGAICPAPQQCASGQMCCDQGATFCGGGCCPSTSTCQNNRCLAFGQTSCGSNVCSSGQVCLGNTVCCNQGDSLCNNACCPQGNVCVNNQCVPAGSSACGVTTVCNVNQFCGNTQTGVCCQTNTQIGCFQNCCPLTQLCNQFTQQCVDRFSNNCGPGQVWCPSANQCCNAGQRCFVGGCGTGSGTFGRRLLQA